jgi:methylated-DNA-[protein]-cysteine S-methyltransferase
MQTPQPDTKTRFSTFDSPVGELLATLDASDRLTGLRFNSQELASAPSPVWVRDDEALGAVREQLASYFAGELLAFDLPLELDGSPFQREVWGALREIPYGETASYAEVAEAVGRPSAARAVGNANGSNPVAIIVPCHRVIAAGGKLGGYGGGLDRKRLLLELEAAAGERSGQALRAA